ncbi:ABC transporter ATP-binding protein [Lachnoclostridium sp. MSJ-17]|uniref:ABC transporter ATP-binding protein n=1 Tax=Lachnoclostridium sp. MSJ-17 TaxID=2841516 RepID=UPI001C114D29|nr:ABC transporter ATP-binding protein [Lachnoclostridium sp. MSJ-17]MBU5462799.1 ABC transporter ATP-binding protein [Lachnoclostridium sp. MSJ-17]
MKLDKDCVIKTEHLTKRYTLGVIGSGTLRRDLQSWYARRRGRDDPNRRIGSREYEKGELFTALEDFDIEIKRGERVGIIGANGAGKSTFLKLLSRITSPTEGKIAYRGRIASMLEVGTGFSGELTGRENIYLNGAILGMTKSEVEKKIDEIIRFSECETFIDTPVKRYSSGMFVKLAFAVAAHLDAEILIMDEVLAVGDMKFQKKCIAKMRELAIDENRTVLYVSHNMSTIQELCSRCVVLEHGKKVFDGEVDEAIKLYLGGENDELYSFEYTDDKHKEKVRRKLVNLTRAKFPGRTSSWFYDDEQVPIELDWTYLEDVERMGLRVEISDIRHYPITAFVIDDAGGGKKGENRKMRLNLDISALAQGIYCVRYVFFVSTHSDFKPEPVEIATGLTIRKRLRREGENFWYKSWGSVVSKGVEIVNNEKEYGH